MIRRSCSVHLLTSTSESSLSLTSSSTTDLILSVYKRFSKYFMNFFDAEVLVTLLELQSQEVVRLQHDLKIKEEAELPQIKELLKKSEAHWKHLHSLMIKKFSTKRFQQESESPELLRQVNLLTTIRFQVQMLYSPIQLSKDTSEAGEENAKRFTENLCKGVVTNMVSYFEVTAGNGMLIERFKKGKRSQDIELDQSVLETYKDSSVDLYWLELVSLNIEQVLKSKSKKQTSTSRPHNIKLMMSMNNLKKTYTEFIDFAVSFGAYYERYFLENESQDTDLELIRNFGRLIYLFSKGFTIPGRQKLEDLRETFKSLLKVFRIPQIVPKILSILKGNFSKGSLLLANTTGLREELTVMVYNIYKMIVFSMLSLELDKEFFYSLFKVWISLCWHLFDSLGFLRMNRLVHLLSHKPSAVADEEQQYWAHAVYFDYEVKVLLCSNALNVVRSAKSANDLSLKMAEKELLQLYRCLYYMPLETIRAIDKSVHEGETQEMILLIPDYSMIPGMDSQDNLTVVTPAEAQLLIDMLSHFFLAKLETDIGGSIREKLDFFSKIKQPPSGQNKKQILEFSIPGKIKKSLNKFIGVCFEAIKVAKDDWLSFPEAKLLKKKFPEYLEYRKKIKQKDWVQDLDSSTVNFIDQMRMQIKEGLKTVAGVSEIDISLDSIEVLYNLLLSNNTYKAIFPDYVFNEGEIIERTRFKEYLNLCVQVRERLDRSSLRTPRELTDNKLNMNGITILMTLFMHFNDSEKIGSLLADGANLAAESLEKLTEISQGLSLFENVGKLTISCASLMECPIWLFLNQVYQIRVFSLLLDLLGAIHSIWSDFDLSTFF